MEMMRDEFAALEQNGITRTAFRRIGDPKVIALWFGEGDLATPEIIRNGAKDALDDGYTFYGHTRGRDDLRKAIKTYLENLYRVTIDDERITVPGSSMLGVTFAAQMTLGAADHAIIVSPHWPNIDRTIGIIGAEISYVRQRLTPAGWRLDFDDLEASIKPNTRAVYVNSPSNPTGWIMDANDQATMLALARQHGFVVVADEVYHRTVYDADVAPSFLTIASDTDPLIVINGFSKAYAMTGWRLGWMVTPAGYAEQMAVLSECYNTGAPAFIQRAGIVALEQGETIIQSFRQQYERGRDIVMEKLGNHSLFELTAPAGAFYAFPRVPGLKSSHAYVNQILDEQDVGLAPGFTFGPGNEEHFRLCYAQSHERLAEALDRVVSFTEHNIESLT